MEKAEKEREGDEKERKREGKEMEKGRRRAMLGTQGL